jgi:hypothetical protein
MQVGFCGGVIYSKLKNNANTSSATAQYIAGQLEAGREALFPWVTMANNQ